MCNGKVDKQKQFTHIHMHPAHTHTACIHTRAKKSVITIMQLVITFITIVLCMQESHQDTTEELHTVHSLSHNIPSIATVAS